MPELPEVETTRRGVAPLVTGREVEAVVVREYRLRRLIPRVLPQVLQGRVLDRVERRGKYLLFRFGSGTMLVHLGMSGSLRILPAGSAVQKHDHLDIVFSGERCLRLRDPRRFGLVLWTTGPPERHELLSHLGPEPWDEACSADYLYDLSRGRRGAVKNFIMDGRVVVGLGNIYASESLHRAGIHPARAAGRVARTRFAALVDGMRSVLDEAIAHGGTSLRDFVRDDGRPGYFRPRLRVYARTGEVCACGRSAIHQRVIGQRSSFYCPRCQH